MRSILTASSLLALSACATTRPLPEPTIRYRTAAVAVSVGCVVDRPAAVVPLNARVPAAEWKARAPGAKAQAIRAQAGRRMNQTDKLNAATSGCADAPAR